MQFALTASCVLHAKEHMIAPPEVRLATLTDVPAITAMSREYIEGGLPGVWRYERVADALADPEVNVAVVGSPGAVIAFGIMSYADDDAHLLLFAVRPTLRRKGIGGTLLRWLEAVAREGGAKCIRVEARKDNTAGRDFYRAHGYEEREIKKGMYYNLADGVRLEKWLRNDQQA